MFSGCQVTWSEDFLMASETLKTATKACWILMDSGSCRKVLWKAGNGSWSYFKTSRDWIIPSRCFKPPVTASKRPWVDHKLPISAKTLCTSSKQRKGNHILFVMYILVFSKPHHLEYKRSDITIKGSTFCFFGIAAHLTSWKQSNVSHPGTSCMLGLKPFRPAILSRSFDMAPNPTTFPHFKHVQSTTAEWWIWTKSCWSLLGPGFHQFKTSSCCRCSLLQIHGLLLSNDFTEKMQSQKIPGCPVEHALYLLWFFFISEIS